MKHTLLASAGTLEGIETSIGQPISTRYFLESFEHAMEHEDAVEGRDYMEVDEKAFIENDGSVRSERHTVFQNGVDQLVFYKTVEGGF